MQPPPFPSDDLAAWALWGVIGLAGVVAMLAWRYEAAKAAEISYLRTMVETTLTENRRLTATIAQLSEILQGRR